MENMEVMKKGRQWDEKKKRRMKAMGSLVDVSMGTQHGVHKMRSRSYC